MYARAHGTRRARTRHATRALRPPWMRRALLIILPPKTCAARLITLQKAELDSLKRIAVSSPDGDEIVLTVNSYEAKQIFYTRCASLPPAPIQSRLRYGAMARGAAAAAEL